MKKLTIRTKLTIVNVALLLLMCLVLTLSINASAKKAFTKIVIVPSGSSSPYEPIYNEDSSVIYDKEGNVISISENRNKETFPAYSIQNAIAVSNFVDTTYIYLAIIVILGGIATYFIIKNQVKPIEQLTSDIQNLTSNNLNSELTVKTNSAEIEKLTLAFNSMTANLQQSFEKQKRFSQMSAHEFRTPLAVMKTKLQVFKMKENHNEKDYQTLIDAFSNNTERLTSVIDCLLTLTNDEKSTMDDVIEIEEIINSVERDVQPQLDAKSITLSKNIETFKFLGNKTLFHRAIFNLVENAIRYNNDNGNIEISALKTDFGLVFSVSDDGIGIPDLAKQKIFDPFFTVDKSRSRASGGAGLGLSFVKDIVIKHNGTIEATNNDTQGTVFTITLPLQ